MTSNELSRQKLFYACCAYLASFLSTRSKKKSTAIAVLFFLEMKRADAHEASCEATHEAGLRPMKRAFGSRRSYCALRFMARARRFTEAVRLLLHIRQRRMLHSKLPPRVLKNTENCAIINSERRWRYEKLIF